MARMPLQKPGRSKQDYATPRDFLDAVKLKFGVKTWAWDLAATRDNSVCGYPNYYGPDRTPVECRDSLSCDWTKLRGDLWLNPPYADIEPWAEKCATSTVYSFKPPRRIFLLVPASVGSNWWADHVHGKALVVFPRPRLSFDGKAPYPKDTSLIVFGEKPGYELWRWDGRK
jgi:phage N-6-adenine-methyltransferase